MNISKIQSVSIRTPEKPGEHTIVTVNDQTFTASTQSGAISQALDYLGEPTTPENIVEFIERATQGVIPILTNAQTGENLGISLEPEGVIPPGTIAPPVKPTRKRKRKVEKKPELEDKFIGRVFRNIKGELLRVVEVTPPTDWMFGVKYLDRESEMEIGILGLKEFKELIELVPKRTRRKEGK